MGILLTHGKTPIEYVSIMRNEKEFLKYMLVLFYNEIYEAKKSLETKKYVDEVNVVEFSDQYNLFLTILNQLRSSELKKIINKYQI